MICYSIVYTGYNYLMMSLNIDESQLNRQIKILVNNTRYTV